MSEPGTWVRPGAERRVIHGCGATGAEVDGVGAGVDRDGCPHGAAADEPRSAPSRRRSGGIVQNGDGHAGFRFVLYAITKPRLPRSEPAAPKTSVLLAHIGALVCE